MNRYSVWKYLLMAAALIIGFFYALPNFFGELPAVQISSAKATVKLDADVFQKVEQTLALNRIQTRGLTFERVGPAGGYGYPVARQRAAVKKPESGRLRSCIYGRAQSAKRLSGLAEGAIRAPHVFRSGFARRRAFPVTGRYGGRAG